MNLERKTVLITGANRGIGGADPRLVPVTLQVTDSAFLPADGQDAS